MADCKTCEYETMCTMPDFVRNDLKNCKVYEPKKNRTNADRIRAMNDEELHNFIRAIRCCITYGDDCDYPYCHSMKGNLCNGIKDNKDEELLNWLQSEAE